MAAALKVYEFMQQLQGMEVLIVLIGLFEKKKKKK